MGRASGKRRITCRRTLLGRGVAVLAVLTVLCGVLPACAIQGPSHQTHEMTADGRGSWGWGTTWYYFSFCDIALVLLVLVALGAFVLGIRRGRYVWGPLTLGLFALGFGLIDATMQMIDANVIVASRPALGIDGVASHLATLAEGTSKALVRVLCGLVAAMLGGLLTWAIHTRTRYLKKKGAEGVSEEGG